MKNPLLIASSIACLLAQSALAQISLTASPTSQGPLNPGDSFAVTFTLTVPQNTAPSDLIGFDLLLETVAANSGFFSIANGTGIAPFNDSRSGTGTFPDSLTTAKSNRAGFAQNMDSQGFTPAAAVDTPFSGSVLTLTLQIAPNTPANTYSFRTTSLDTSGVRGSSVNSSDRAAAYFVDNAATFSITVVPEPATWSLIAFGALVAVGVQRFRNKSRV